ncbi:MAG: DUF5701 family protein [bacterium]|nr:DUF5701 family protein [bacterium]
MLHRFALVLLGLSTTYVFAEGGPTPEALGKAFDAQVARLTERGYPKMFGESKIFDETMAKLRAEAVQYVPAKPEYTFLIVIPENDAPLAWQVRQIITPSGEACNIPLEFAFRENVEMKNNGTFTTPREPYLCYDIDAGDATANQWICDVAVGLATAHRRGLTLLECVSFLVQHPELLSKTKVAAFGTMIDDPKRGTMCAYWNLENARPYHPYVSMTDWTLLNNPRSGDWYRHIQFPTCRE